MDHVGEKNTRRYRTGKEMMAVPERKM